MQLRSPAGSASCFRAGIVRNLKLFRRIEIQRSDSGLMRYYKLVGKFAFQSDQYWKYLQISPRICCHHANIILQLYSNSLSTSLYVFKDSTRANSVGLNAFVSRMTFASTIHSHFNFLQVTRIACPGESKIKTLLVQFWINGVRMSS